jgi:hypothetical protein
MSQDPMRNIFKDSKATQTANAQEEQIAPEVEQVKHTVHNHIGFETHHYNNTNVEQNGDRKRYLSGNNRFIEQSSSGVVKYLMKFLDEQAKKLYTNHRDKLVDGGIKGVSDELKVSVRQTDYSNLNTIEVEMHMDTDRKTDGALVIFILKNSISVEAFGSNHIDKMINLEHINVTEMNSQFTSKHMNFQTITDVISNNKLTFNQTKNYHSVTPVLLDTELLGDVTNTVRSEQSEFVTKQMISTINGALESYVFYTFDVKRDPMDYQFSIETVQIVHNEHSKRKFYDDHGRLPTEDSDLNIHKTSSGEVFDADFIIHFTAHDVTNNDRGKKDNRIYVKMEANTEAKKVFFDDMGYKYSLRGIDKNGNGHFYNIVTGDISIMPYNSLRYEIEYVDILYLKIVNILDVFGGGNLIGQYAVKLLHNVASQQDFLKKVLLRKGLNNNFWRSVQLFPNDGQSRDYIFNEQQVFTNELRNIEAKINNEDGDVGMLSQQKFALEQLIQNYQFNEHMVNGFVNEIYRAGSSTTSAGIVFETNAYDMGSVNNFDTVYSKWNVLNKEIENVENEINKLGPTEESRNTPYGKELKNKLKRMKLLLEGHTYDLTDEKIGDAFDGVGVQATKFEGVLSLLSSEGESQTPLSSLELRDVFKQAMRKNIPIQHVTALHLPQDIIDGFLRYKNVLLSTDRFERGVQLNTFLLILKNLGYTAGISGMKFTTGVEMDYISDLKIVIRQPNQHRQMHTSQPMAGMMEFNQFTQSLGNQFNPHQQQQQYGQMHNPQQPFWQQPQGNYNGYNNHNGAFYQNSTM